MAPTTAFTTQDLDREAWPALFAHLIDARPVVTSLTIDGDMLGGTEASQLPLESITYEDGDDQIAIGLDGRDGGHGVLWHYVDGPRQLLRDDGDGLPECLEIVSADGTHTVLELEVAG
ncbi:MAG: DUF5335 family protein [Solirubrobacterales bacterium]|nr:DUF5335 family protein [Solirubrobacterales bacterium]